MMKRIGELHVTAKAEVEELEVVRTQGGETNVTLSAIDSNNSALYFLEDTGNNRDGIVLRYDGQANKFHVKGIENNVEFPLFDVSRPTNVVNFDKPPTIKGVALPTGSSTITVSSPMTFTGTLNNNPTITLPAAEYIDPTHNSAGYMTVLQVKKLNGIADGATRIRNAGDVAFTPTNQHFSVQDAAAALNALYARSGVSSFKTRTGDITPVDGDYNASQITVSPAIAGGSNVQAVLTTLDTHVGVSSGKISALEKQLNSKSVDRAGTLGTRSDVIPYIDSVGTLELGSKIDFHTTGSAVDFDIRLDNSAADLLELKGGSLNITDAGATLTVDGIEVKKDQGAIVFGDAHNSIKIDGSNISYSKDSGSTFDPLVTQTVLSNNVGTTKGANLSNEDLNTVHGITNKSVWRHQPSVSAATTAKHYPENAMGVLEVRNSGGSLIQQIYTTNAGKIYTRSSVDGGTTWPGSWTLINAEDTYNKTESDARYVNITGDAMTGDLKLTGSATPELTVNSNAIGNAAGGVVRFTNSANATVSYIGNLNNTDETLNIVSYKGDIKIAPHQSTDKTVIVNPVSGSSQGTDPNSLVRYDHLTSHLGLYVSTSGDTMTGDLIIDKAAPKLILKSHGNNGAAATSFIEFQDGSGAVIGSLSDSSNTNSDIVLDATAGGSVKISGSSVLLNNPISASTQGTTDDSLVRRDFLISHSNAKVNKTGSTMTGDLTMDNSHLVFAGTGDATFIYRQTKPFVGYTNAEGGYYLGSDNNKLFAGNSQKGASVVTSTGAHLIFHEGHVPTWQQTGGNDYFTKTGTVISVAGANWLKMAANNVGLLPSAPGSSTTSNSLIGNSTNWFNESWVNAYRGGTLDITGNAQIGDDGLTVGSTRVAARVNNTLIMGANSTPIVIETNDSDLIHRRNGTNYTIFTSHNPPSATHVGGISKTGDTMTGALTIEQSQAGPNLVLKSMTNDPATIDLIPHAGQSYKSTISVADSGVLSIIPRKPSVIPPKVAARFNADGTVDVDNLIIKDITQNPAPHKLQFLTTNNQGSGIYFTNSANTQEEVSIQSNNTGISIHGATEYYGPSTTGKQLVTVDALNAAVGGLNLSNYVDKTDQHDIRLATSNFIAGTITTSKIIGTETGTDPVLKSRREEIIIPGVQPYYQPIFEIGNNSAFTRIRSGNNNQVEIIIPPTGSGKETYSKIYHEQNPQPTVAKLTTPRQISINNGPGTAFDGSADVNLDLPGATETEMGGMKARFDPVTKILHITTDGTNP